MGVAVGISAGRSRTDPGGWAAGYLGAWLRGGLGVPVVS